MSEEIQIHKHEQFSLLGEFLDYLKLERRYSDYTVRNYKKAIEVYFEWLVGEQGGRHLQEINRRLLVRYIRAYSDSHKTTTVHNHFSALRSFYKFLRKLGYLESNPMESVTLPKKEKTLPKFLTENQIKELLDAPIKQLKAEQIDAFTAWQDRTVMEFLYGGGLRISECLALTFRDINSQGVAKVMGKGSKERLCPLGPVAMECLKNLRTYEERKTDSEPIFTTKKGLPLSAREVQKRLKKYLSTSNLPADITPHKLRHSYATHLLAHGAQLSLLRELLGHASLSTTQIYTHLDLARLKKAHSQAHPRA